MSEQSQGEQVAKLTATVDQLQAELARLELALTLVIVSVILLSLTGVVTQRQIVALGKELGA